MELQLLLDARALRLQVRRMNKLLAKFLVLNFAGLGLLATAFLHGIAQRVIAVDTSYVSLIILALFALALISATTKAWELSGLLAGSRKLNFRNPRSAEIALLSNISHIKVIGAALVILGLIGTVIGFILSTASIDPNTVSDVNQVGTLVGGLLHGMGVAFYTTLVGAIFSLWLSLNYQILFRAAATIAAKYHDIQ